MILCSRNVVWPFSCQLLEPGEAPAVRVERGDDIGVTVGIDVVRKHLCAAAAGEFEGMRLPRC